MQQCPRCGETGFTVGYVDDECILTCDGCDYDEGARLDEVFDHYMRASWAVSKWWVDCFRRVYKRAVTHEIMSAILAEMPEYPWESDGEDLEDDEDEDF